jgi:hypothetical protein
MSVIKFSPAVGAHLSVKDLGEAFQGLTFRSEYYRNTQWIRNFLKNLEIDRYFGSPNNTNQHGLNEWSYNASQKRWYNGRKSVAQFSTKKHDDGTYTCLQFDPRAVISEIQGTTYRAVYRQDFEEEDKGANKDGSFGSVLYFKLDCIQDVTHGDVLDPARQENRVYYDPYEASTFVLKFPYVRVGSNARDTPNNDAHVLTLFENKDVFNEVLGGAVLYTDAYPLVCALEKCDGTLNDFANQCSVEDAVKVAYAVLQEFEYVYRKTGLLYVDTKVNNIFYSTQEVFDNMNYFSILVGDLGSFYQENAVSTEADKIEGLFVSPKPELRSHIASNVVPRVTFGHTAFGIGCLILSLVDLGPTRLSKRRYKISLETLLSTETEFFEEYAKDRELITNHKCLDLLDHLLGYTDLGHTVGTLFYYDNIYYCMREFEDTFPSFHYVPPTYPATVKISRERSTSLSSEMQPASKQVRLTDDDAHKTDSESDARSHHQSDSPSPIAHHGPLRPFGSPGNPGLATKDLAETLVYGGGFRSMCQCECGCDTVRKSGDLNWEIVCPKPRRGRPPDVWAEHNTEPHKGYFIVCPECANNFKKGSPHECEKGPSML